MNLYPVKSNNILFTGYDEINQILKIEFKLHVIHHYLEVPLDLFVDLMKADDIDQFYFDFIQHQYHLEVF
jgi:hypothetical protein